MSRFNDVVPEGTAQPNVLHALTKKRSEIAGQIEHNQLSLRRLIAELDHIDAAIRIFNPAIDISAIRAKPVPPRHAAFKGEVTRLVLDSLREANRPLTSRDIAVLLMEDRGLNKGDRDLSVIMVKRICACLRVQRQKGLVRNVPLVGNLQGWEISND